MPQEEKIIPKFTYEDVKFSTDSAIFERALGLFKKRKIKNVTTGRNAYDGLVSGSIDYTVSVSVKNVDIAYCECYMGQNDQLCKHVLALALEVLYKNNLVDKNGTSLRKINYDNLEIVKKEINNAMRKIKPYQGPSRIWFSYQMSLSVGTGKIVEIVKLLPANLENTKLSWGIVQKLSKKLAYGGVDDSDGTVGDCCIQVLVLINGWRRDQKIDEYLSKCSKIDTGFGFEDYLKK